MLVGVVGKPNVGKSTFFKASSLSDVEIANYPFATIKPNSGMGYVKLPDVALEFDKVSNPREGYVADTWRFVPVQLIDVAGLVPGAYEGKGMGNQFLDDLRQADVLIHVIDISGSVNEKGEPCEPLSYDPANDVRFLEIELDMWYLGILKKGWDKFARSLQQEKKPVQIGLAKQLSGLGVNEAMVEDALGKLDLDPLQPLSWDEEQLKGLATYLRKETKPMIIACNKIDIPGAHANFERLVKEFSEYTFVGCSAESELALKEAHKAGLLSYIPGEGSFSIPEGSSLSEKQRAGLDFIKTHVLDVFGSSGVQEVLNKAVFDVLGYMAIFPGGASKLEDKDGNTLPDCFLLRGGASALDFAYKLHTDLGKNFIRAIDVRTKRSVGKEHQLKHLDIIEIVAGR